MCLSFFLIVVNQAYPSVKRTRCLASVEVHVDYRLDIRRQAAFPHDTRAAACTSGAKRSSSLCSSRRC